MKSIKLQVLCLFMFAIPSAVMAQDTGTVNGHQWVDLGLPSGLKWATCNVGASSPGVFGNYYSWAETREKSECLWDNVKYSEGIYYTKYNTQSDYGQIDNKSKLDYSDDAARASWGGIWRMPTKDDFYELVRYCSWSWIQRGGDMGYIVTGPNGNRIFLPAAGYKDGATIYIDAYIGNYWTSSLDTGNPSSAWVLYFDSSNIELYKYYRYGGRSVRPVTE